MKSPDASPAVSRIGLIGLDTSHVPAFTRVFNDPNYPGHRTDGRVVAAYPGGSPDIHLSHSRVPQFTREVEAMGVEILDSPEAVAEAVDLVFLESIDGRVHLDQLKRTIKYRRPTFIDKPLAHDSGAAAEIFRLAREAGVPLMSCSSLRYAEGLITALTDDAAGDIIGCDAFGPITEVDQPPGLFWYGIHTAEILFAVLGTGCRGVQSLRNDDGEVIVGTWADGRMGCIRGMRPGHSRFGATIHRQRGFQQANLNEGQRSNYDLMLDAIMRTLPLGQSDIPEAQTLEIIRFLEAGNISRATGNPVEL